MKLIGLVGRKSVGKDTAALALREHGYHVARFAGALKDMLRAYLSYVGVSKIAVELMVEDAQYKEIADPTLLGRTPRYAMQTLGTEWGRELIGEDIWVRACMQHCHQFDRAVITDVRFPNEVAAVKQAGGVVVRIVRNVSHNDTHASENFIDTLDVDHEIDNNGTIIELQEKLLTIAKGQIL